MCNQTRGYASFLTSLLVLGAAVPQHQQQHELHRKRTHGFASTCLIVTLFFLLSKNFKSLLLPIFFHMIKKYLTVCCEHLLWKQEKRRPKSEKLVLQSFNANFTAFKAFPEHQHDCLPIRLPLFASGTIFSCVKVKNSSFEGKV